VTDIADSTIWLAFKVQTGIFFKSNQDLYLRIGSTDIASILTMKNANAFTAFGVNWTTTNAQLMLFKIVMRGAAVNEDVTLYVNPTLTADPATWVPKASGTLAMNSGFDGINILSTGNASTGGGFGTAWYFLDEIRLATTWQGAVGQSATTPIETWRQAQFGTTSNTGDAADEADPNHNGIVNLLEYALGGDPVGNTTGVGILPQAEWSAGNALQIRFTRYLDRTDLTLTVQAADSPAGPWTDLAASAAGAVFAPGANAAETGTGTTRTVVVTDLYPTDDPAHPKRFMRLKVAK
jgi:hypothetical protein